MKVEKVITVNIGNYESVKLGVSDSVSFQACDHVIDEELKQINLGTHRAVKP